MALSIKSGEAERLARELAEATGESLTEAVTKALRERLERQAQPRRGRRLAEEILAIGARCARLPLLDDRSDEAILGYDDAGLPR